MATILAAKSGVWSDSATWVGGNIPGNGDIAVANSYTVTIDASIICQAIRNDTTGSATAGGFFSFGNRGDNLNAGWELTADVYAGDISVAVSCLQASGTRSGTVIGTVYGNGYGPGSSGIAAGIYGAINNGTGTLYVKATVQGSRGMPAVSGPMQFLDTAHASAKVRATSGLTEITLRHPDAVVPFQGDVLAGTLYNSNTYSGTATPHGSISTNTQFSALGPNLADGTPLLDETDTPLTTDDDITLTGI